MTEESLKFARAIGTEVFVGNYSVSEFYGYRTTEKDAIENAVESAEIINAAHEKAVSLAVLKARDEMRNECIETIVQLNQRSYQKPMWWEYSEALRRIKI